ncbi:MAG: hypothetical protein ACLFR8_06840 [Alkalispirochaeta sp.]
MNSTARLITTIVVSIVIPIVVVGTLGAQNLEDPVVDTVGDIAVALGRLVPAALHPDDFSLSSTNRPGGVTVAVDTITHDGQEPRIALLLRSVAEEELLFAADNLQSLGDVDVLDDPDGAQFRARIRSSAGTERVLFSLQIVDRTGRVRAATRVTAPAVPALINALAPTRSADDDSRDDGSDTADGATAIALGQSITGRSLEQAGDVDWYRFTVPPDMPTGSDSLPGIRIYTTGTTDTYLEVYGPDSPTTLISENDDAHDSNASVSIPVEPGSQYWARLRGFADSATGMYGIHLEATELVLDDAEPNNDRATATPLSPGDIPFSGSIRPSGDRDWFLLSEQFLQAYRSDTADSSGSSASRGSGVSGESGTETALVAFTAGDLDTTITLYDADGTEIGYNDDGGEGGNARIVVSGDAPLFLEVRGYGTGVEGDYTLAFENDTIAVDPFEPDNTMDDASEIEWNASPQRRTFSGQSDQDWVRLEVVGERRRVRLETYGDIDTFLTLHSADGIEIVSSDDDGYGLNGRIEEDLAPGAYYLLVTPLYLESANPEYALEARLIE